MVEVLKRWTFGLLRVALLGLIALAGWWYADTVWDASTELREALLSPVSQPPVPTVDVLNVDARSITLARTAASQVDGIAALRAQQGSGEIGPIRALSDEVVVRDFTLLDGMVATGPGATIDANLYPGDPFSARGVVFREEEIAGELGIYPAWYIPGVEETWVIYVHGRGSDGRSEVNRVLPYLVELGYPVLIPTYRNDPAAPRSFDEQRHWGLTEWADIETAASFARRQGADALVMFGHEMGASIVSMFLHESPVAARVAGVIFDAPVLDVGEVADLEAQRAEQERWVAVPAKALASFRFDLKWSALDQVARADEFKVPMLILHGTADEIVPVRSSDDLALARPDLVTLERFEGVGHDFAWNADPVRYEQAVGGFLARVSELGPPAPELDLGPPATQG